MPDFPEIKSSQDLLLINVLSAVLVVLVLLVPDSPLRTLLGIPFVLFFPGYTLINALFPAKHDLGGIERLSLSLGLSLALVPLIGLGLNYSPWGIRLAPIIASLYLFTMLMSLITLYRRAKLPAEQKLILKLPINMPKWGTMRKFDKLFLAGIITAIILVCSVTSYLAVAPETGTYPFTEFYILGANATLADYPLNMTLGQNSTITLGVTNHEYENATYKIAINLENQTLTTIDNIQLAHEANWSQNYTLAPDKTGSQMKLAFQLYKENADDPYRSLQLWVTVHPPQ
jgi:uncharacterized membrane protein